MKVGVNIAIMEHGSVLLTKRRDFEVWCLPGGHVEEGESIAQAAVRETVEETGLQVRLTHLVGLYSIPDARAWVNLIVLFAAVPAAGALRAQEEEVLDIAYFRDDELPGELLWGHRQRIEDALGGKGGGEVWLQHVPFDPVVDRHALYAMREKSGLAGNEFYARHFGWSDPDRDELLLTGTEVS